MLKLLKYPKTQKYIGTFIKSFLRMIYLKCCEIEAESSTCCYNVPGAILHDRQSYCICIWPVVDFKSGRYLVMLVFEWVAGRHHLWKKNLYIYSTFCNNCEEQYNCQNIFPCLCWPWLPLFGCLLSSLGQLWSIGGSCTWVYIYMGFIWFSYGWFDIGQFWMGRLWEGSDSWFYIGGENLHRHFPLIFCCHWIQNQ